MYMYTQLGSDSGASLVLALPPRCLDHRGQVAASRRTHRVLADCNRLAEKHVRMYRYRCIHTKVCTDVDIHTYVQYVYIYAYIYIYTHMYARTYIPIYLYTQKSMALSRTYTSTVSPILTKPPPTKESCTPKSVAQIGPALFSH